MGTLMRMVMGVEDDTMDMWQGLLLYGYGVERRVEPVRREQLGTALKRQIACISMWRWRGMCFACKSTIHMTVAQEHSKRLQRLL